MGTRHIIESLVTDPYLAVLKGPVRVVNGVRPSSIAELRLQEPGMR